MHSPLVHCLLVLFLLLGQATNALHALEHLVPSSGKTADRTEPMPSSPLASMETTGAGIGGAPDRSTDGTTNGVANGSAAPEHVDDGACTLCLLLGAGHAPARSPDGGPLATARAAVVPTGVAIAIPHERAYRLPPARGPPTFS